MDDLFANGDALAAANDLLVEIGVNAASIKFLVVFELTSSGGRNRLPADQVYSLMKFEV